MNANAINTNVLTTAVNILAAHISPSPTITNTSTINTNVLNVAIALIQAHSKSNAPATPTPTPTPTQTVYEDQQRRGDVDITGKLVIANQTDPTYPPTKTDLLSILIKPEYSANLVDNQLRPTGFKITPTINGAIDRTAEIDKLNDAMKKQQEKIDDLTNQVKTTTATLATSTP